jgi:hypothetical protein
MKNFRSADIVLLHVGIIVMDIEEGNSPFWELSMPFFDIRLTMQ